MPAEQRWLQNAEAAPGVIENVYRVQIMNTAELPRKFRITAAGLPGLAVAGIAQPVEVAAADSHLVPLRLQAAADAAAPGSHKVELIIEAVDDPAIQRRERTTFILPRP